MLRDHCVAALIAAFFAIAFAPAAGAQAANDHCGTAIPIGVGTTFGSNVGATTGPDPLGGCGLPASDVWFEFVAPCNGPWAASTCGAGTSFDTVLTVWEKPTGCGALIGVLCNDDFCGQPFSPTSSYCTFESVAGTTYILSVAGASGAQGSFELSLHSIGCVLEFFTTGPGTLGYTVEGGPQGGTVFTAITLNSSFYPYGWFNGIDIEFGEIVSELTLGFPFIATAGSVCGDVTMGPFTGLPPGLTVYGVTVGIPAGTGFPDPAFTSPPASGLVP
jgi:hypothetical protein